MIINHKGEVYPCCYVAGNIDYRIGLVTDKDIIEKLLNYDIANGCNCYQYKFIKLSNTAVNKITVNKGLYLELSLLCNAKCAMCIVDAPYWDKKYDLYDTIRAFIDLWMPDKLWVQGGEILIQKQTLQWLEQIKKDHQNVKINLLTNGNVSLRMIPIVEKIFSAVAISITGFQAETYETITSLSLANTVSFTEELARNNKVEIYPKFLITPITAHETHLFLDWAIDVATSELLIQSLVMPNHLDKTGNYWDIILNDELSKRIFERASKKLKGALISKSTLLKSRGVKVCFIDAKAAELMQIDAKFIEDSNLRDVVFLGECSFQP